MLLLLLCPRPPPPSSRAPRDPAVIEPRAALLKRRALGTEPAPSPSPVGGARPRGREQGGETGSSPQPLPCPRPGPPGAAPAPSLPLRPGTRDPQRQPLGAAPPSGRVPRDPESSARRRLRSAAAHARRRPGRMRFPRHCRFLTFGYAALKKGKEK